CGRWGGGWADFVALAPRPVWVTAPRGVGADGRCGFRVQHEAGGRPLRSASTHLVSVENCWGSARGRDVDAIRVCRELAVAMRADAEGVAGARREAGDEERRRVGGQGADLLERPT